MLRHLRVTNFAILSDVALELGEGFNVLTGETGAGKSLIVEAVNLLRGGRASADIPREGAKEAVVEAIFEVPPDLAGRVETLLDNAGLPAADGAGEVLVRRVIQRGGRSRTYVNGALTTARRLAELGGVLVDLSGQHQHQGLVDAAKHREILDAFADQPKQAETMAATWTALRNAEAAIDEFRGDGRDPAAMADYLRFQLDEIEAAAPTSGEDEALATERTRLQAVDRLQAGAGSAHELLYAGHDAAVDRLSAAAGELEELAATDQQLTEPLAQIEEARVLVEEAATALRDYASRLEANPDRLATVEDRLALLTKLMRKHDATLEAVVERAAELRRELDTVERRDDHLAELEKTRSRAEAAARRAADKLSSIRKRAAKRVRAEVAEALAELGMTAAELTVRCEPCPVGPHGADKIELMLAANPGEGAKPLAKIASGGELSRVMLALKLVLRRAEEVATYVFDEVDAGIGGAIAEVVGRQIQSLAQQRQVLCVTHLPQIAAFADIHFRGSKSEAEGRTETLVKRLTANERREETARMLAGVKVTKRARAHAEEMLRSARS